MIAIGDYHRLEAVRRTDFGLYLSDGETDILLPRKFVPEDFELGESLRVFVTTDSEDRLVATTQRPLGKVGDFVGLDVKQVTPTGAFMDWGLDKDLLVPFAEQYRRIEEGKRYVVRIVRDDRTQRVFGSTKLTQFLSTDTSALRERMEVGLMVVESQPQGVRMIVDDTFSGMLFNDEVHQRFRPGQRLRGYIKRIREDGAVALSLSPQGYSATLEQGPQILHKLRAAGGFLPIGDRTDPDIIRKEFGLSKGAYKKVIGNLFKEGEIEVEPFGIRLKKK